MPRRRRTSAAAESWTCKPDRSRRQARGSFCAQFRKYEAKRPSGVIAGNGLLQKTDGSSPFTGGREKNNDVVTQ